MSQVMAKTTFFALPTELRLHIAAYALEQPDAGLTREHRPGEMRDCFRADNKYKSSTNLAIRLVCRQFNVDFRRLAIQKTLFVLPKGSTGVVQQQSDGLLRDVKKLRVHFDPNDITEWNTYPLNKPCLRLDQLELVIMFEDDNSRKALVGLFRRLQNVKQIRLLANEKGRAWGSHEFIKLLGEMLKEDHYQRYDAPNAPNPEDSWWEWSYSDDVGQTIFVAQQQPKPIMLEEDYMLLMKPKVDYIIECMVAYST